MRRALGALLLIVPQLVVAQQRAAAPSEGDRAMVHRVVDSVASLVAANYVFPDTGRLVAEHLRGRLRGGAYNVPMGMAQLADRLSADMKAVNGDLHLYVMHNAGPARPAGDAPRPVMRRPGDPVPNDVLLQSRRTNFDFQRVERLAGNVAYLSLQQLSSRGSDEAFRVVDAAMAFLERADAMIIDLRQTLGGEPRMSDYVASYFFGPDSVRTLNSYSRSTNRTVERWTTRVAGTQRPDIPVFLLVGPGTASGTEDLAFIFKQAGRGKLVGERTAGAGRLTRTYPVGDGFTASVSGGRTYDPRTGKEWERTGIAPDIASSTDDALAVAHAAALSAIAERTTDASWRQFALRAREGVEARAKPVSVPARTLAEYAGKYDLRVIVVAAGKLWFQRDANRPREELLPLPDGTFAYGEASRVSFVREGGRVVAMQMATPTGQLSTFPRSR